MSDTLLVVVIALLGGVVGWLLRPVVERNGAPLTSRLPFMEIATAVGFALAASRYDDWRLAPVLVLIAGCVALSTVDLIDYRLPNAILFPCGALAIGLIVVGELIDGEPSRLVQGLIAAALYCGVLFVLFLVNPSGMGFGDVKLAILLGFFCGWVADTRLDGVRAVMIALFVGSLLGLVLGFARAAVFKVGRRVLPDPEGDPEGRGVMKTTFPFGPPLMMAAVAIVLYPGPILG